MSKPGQPTDKRDSECFVGGTGRTGGLRANGMKFLWEVNENTLNLSTVVITYSYECIKNHSIVYFI